MLGNILGAAAGPLLSGLFGDEKTEQFLGFTQSGWKGDNTSAFSQYPQGPDDVFGNWPSPLSERPSDAAGADSSFFDKADQFLGSNPGKLASGVAAGFIDDARQRRNTRKHHQFLRGQGLTPHEIAGSGGGGPVQSQGSTLGSGPAQQMTQQQSFQATENQKERDNKLAIAKLQQQAPLKQAEIADLRAAMEFKLMPGKLKQLDAQNAKLWKEVERLGFDMENFWPAKFASMGPENGMMAIAAFNEGIDFERVLTGRGGPVTAAERAQYDELFKTLRAVRSTINTEMVGVWDLIKYLQRGGRALNPKDNVLGQQLLLGDLQKRETFNRYQEDGRLFRSR